MKKYIGTKQVKAEPMTRIEAEKLLGRNLSKDCVVCGSIYDRKEGEK